MFSDSMFLNIFAVGRCGSVSGRVKAATELSIS